MNIKLTKGEFLYRKGDQSDCMYLIRSGKIGLYSEQKGELIELARLSTGLIVGDLSFFTGDARTSHAKAITDAECFKVPYKTMQQQFSALPPWIQIMTKTLVGQVRSYAAETKSLKEPDEGAAMSRLSLARALATIVLVPQQFGEKTKNGVSIDWATLRMYSNLAFREVSTSVLQLLYVLQSLDLCTLEADKTGPTEVTLKDSRLLTDFLGYYLRAILQNSKELEGFEKIEYNTLQALACPKMAATPIHNGLVEISLVEFKQVAKDLGYPDVNATSVELLISYGIQIQKISADAGVKLRFHQQEIVNLAQFWKILSEIRKLNRPKDETPNPSDKSSLEESSSTQGL